MAPSIINNNAVQGETFLPEQIFVFGGFALRANSLGHLEQIESYAPGHQIRFGSLNYMADIRGDLIFDGFGPMPGVPNCHDEHGLDLLSDNTRDIAPAGAPDLNPGQIDSYAPDHQVRFGNLNYTANIRGDLIFDEFGPMPGASNSHDEHGLDLHSDNARDIAPTDCVA